jgi:hypothetical protein
MSTNPSPQTFNSPEQTCVRDLIIALSDLVLFAHDNVRFTHTLDTISLVVERTRRQMNMRVIIDRFDDTDND